MASSATRLHTVIVSMNYTGEDLEGCRYDLEGRFNAGSARETLFKATFYPDATDQEFQGSVASGSNIKLCLKRFSQESGSFSVSCPDFREVDKTRFKVCHNPDTEKFPFAITLFCPESLNCVAEE